MKTFQENASASNSLSCRRVKELLRSHVHGITKVTRCDSIAQDKAGTDYFAHMIDGTKYSVDLKELNYVPSSAYGDRVLLETDIFGRRRKDGWATDETKCTDLFLIVRGDGSYVVLWARALRKVLKRKKTYWLKRRIAREGINSTPGDFEVFSCGYITVPRAILERECEKVAA